MNIDSSKNLPPGIFEILPFWITCQKQLAEVTRWRSFLQQNSLLRHQNTLEHTHSFSVFSAIAIMKIAEEEEIDGFLLLLGILIHDHGEGILQRDVLYPEKTAKKDCDEYNAFVALIEQCGLDEALKKKLKSAFLLQFAIEGPDCFPAEARELMASIRETHHFEATLFGALEYLDYLMYACEGYLAGDKVILVKVIGNCLKKLNAICERYPVIARVIWTSEVRSWFKTFEATHSKITYASVDLQLHFPLEAIA